MSGAVKTLWLRMLSEGSYSTVAELAQAARMTPKVVDNLVSGLADKGYCRRFKDPNRKNGVGYGVTATCSIPRGVTLAEIASAQAVHATPEEA